MPWKFRIFWEPRRKGSIFAGRLLSLRPNKSGGPLNAADYIAEGKRKGIEVPRRSKAFVGGRA
jgi:hypothetical protein